MTTDEVEFGRRPSELRRAFDQSFADPPQAESTPFENMLAIRVASEPYAIRLSEVSGLFVDKAVTKLPTSLPQLLGIAGFRGIMVPVYDLRAILGYSTGDAPRWLVIAAKTAVGLAFDGFDSHFRIPQTAIAPAERAEHSGQHVSEVLRGEKQAWPIVDMTSVLEAITTRAHQSVPEQEK